MIKIIIEFCLLNIPINNDNYVVKKNREW
jgi:hypothetical protein